VPLFIDTEFTSFGGELISIGIVSDDGTSFYAVRNFCQWKCHPWVRENVLPVLIAEPMDDLTIKRRLVAFLNRQKGQPIYADWPADLMYLLDLLQEPGGFCYDVGDLEMHLIRGMKTHSKLPHNALEDARGLMDAFFGEGVLPDGD
jgi:hypothetical protein